MRLQKDLSCPTNLDGILLDWKKKKTNLKWKFRWFLHNKTIEFYDQRWDMYVLIREPKFSSISYKVGARFRLSYRYIHIRSLIIMSVDYFCCIKTCPLTCHPLHYCRLEEDEEIKVQQHYFGWDWVHDHDLVEDLQDRKLQRNERPNQKNHFRKIYQSYFLFCLPL